MTIYKLAPHWWGIFIGYWTSIYIGHCWWLEVEVQRELVIYYWRLRRFWRIERVVLIPMDDTP